MNKAIHKLLIAMTAAYVALLPQFYLIYDASNRFTLLWNHTQHLAILLAITLLGLFFFGIYALTAGLTNRLRLLRWGRGVAFTWILAFVLIRTLVALFDRGELLPAGIQSILDHRIAKLFYYAVIPMCLILIQPERAKRAVSRLYLLLSPLLAIVFLLPLTYTRYDASGSYLPDELLSAQAKADPDLPNIYIFIFDDWSEPRTYPDGELWDELPNIRAFAKDATSYRQAYAPGAETLTSVMRFVFQKDARFREIDYAGMHQLFKTLPPMDYVSIFDGAEDWYTTAISFYIPFPQMLEDTVDYPVLLDSATEWSLRARVQYYLTTQIGFLRHLGFNVTLHELGRHLRWLSAQRLMHPMALQLISDVDAPLYGFFHYCLPHHPYAWDRDGFREDYTTYKYLENTEDNYLSNLRYLDTVIGEIIAALKHSGKYDNSLIIFTSDHSWRWDPAEKHYSAYDPVQTVAVDKDPHNFFKHVPLFVKTPHQAQGRAVNEPLVTWDLYPILNEVLATGGTVNGAQPAR